MPVRSSERTISHLVESHWGPGSSSCSLVARWLVGHVSRSSALALGRPTLVADVVIWTVEASGVLSTYAWHLYDRRNVKPRSRHTNWTEQASDLYPQHWTVAELLQSRTEDILLAQSLSTRSGALIAVLGYMSAQNWTELNWVPNTGIVRISWTGVRELRDPVGCVCSHWRI